MKSLRIAGAVITGLLMFAALVITPKYISSYLQSVFPYITVSSVISYFFNVYTLILGAILSLITALNIAFNDDKIGAMLKSLKGLTGMTYFLYLFHFGRLAMQITVLEIPLKIYVVVTLGLFLIELAFLIKVIEGVLIFFGK